MNKRRKYEPIGPLTPANGWRACYRDEDGVELQRPLVGFALTSTIVEEFGYVDSQWQMVRRRSEMQSFVGYVAVGYGVLSAEQLPHFDGYEGPEDGHACPEDDQ